MSHGNCRWQAALPAHWQHRDCQPARGPSPQKRSRLDHGFPVISEIAPKTVVQARKRIFWGKKKPANLWPASEAVEILRRLGRGPIQNTNRGKRIHKVAKWRQRTAFGSCDSEFCCGAGLQPAFPVCVIISELVQCNLVSIPRIRCISLLPYCTL